MGRFKPTLSDAARRWNRSPIPTGPMMPERDEETLPSRAISGGIIMALLVMLGGIVWVWQSGPAPATAKGPVAESPAAVGEALATARELMERGEWAKAEAVLIPATVRHPMEQSLRVARAECLSAVKRFAEAYDQYEKALAIGPREAGVEFAAGVAAREAGMMDRALEHLAMAQTLDPSKAEYALALGQIQRRTGSVDASKASLLRAAHLDPDNAFIWGTLAEIALSENSPNLCLQHIGKARALQPEVAEWRLIEAKALKRRGEPDKALRVLSGIEARQRKETPVARLIAECYGMQGRPADAAQILGEAFLASPVDSVLAYEAALAFDRAGNREKALEHAKYAVALGHEGAGRLLERLSGR